ncbi:response regulator [Gracilibacillus salinarum]|uniref:Response regulator n=1 Tax=Gracilibacillus salinarum TaxID=2932255 RepID=A0ABY4GR71_9BACI|nr:response regulator [Gracilibacillus salinarum]UOQ86862.1 response regulator [Gracilibacillus salinarum]
MNVGLFDDEILAIDFLVHQLEKLENIHVLFTSTQPFLDEKKKMLNDIDIIFLDIEMPEISGLELAEKILAYNPSIHIVFVTAFDQYAIKAFELHALDYLLKPVSLDRLKNTVQRVTFTPFEAKDNNSIHPLHLHVLGDLSFQFEDKSEPENIKWRTAKSKELFLYLLHHEGSVVLKSKIVDTLWHHLDVEKAFSHLYVTIYHIRQALQSSYKNIKIVNTEDGYQLKLHHVLLDKNEWKHQLFDTASLAKADLEEQERIMHLYKGSYLESHDYIWVEGERFELEEIWLHHAQLIADAFNQTKHHEKAIHWYTAILKKRPEDERAAFALMKIYASLHYRMLVNHQYKQLQRNLAELDLTIDPQIEAWYKNWR